MNKRGDDQTYALFSQNDVSIKFANQTLCGKCFPISAERIIANLKDFYNTIVLLKRPRVFNMSGN